MIETFDRNLLKSDNALVSVHHFVNINRIEVDFDGIYHFNFQMMPFYGKLQSNMITGARLNIVGRVKVLPHSFYINLQQGQNIWPHPNISFHLNPRFNTIGGKHVIIKNSWLDGNWDQEERSEIHTDFMPSRTFHMIIECDFNGYDVYLNDKLIAQYKYRIDPKIVDTIYIHGDIKLKHISQELQNCS